MSDNPAQQVLSDLFGYLESLETQSGAILQFLKDKGGLNDQQLAPYLEQAANASSVKWRAARVRMEHLFAVSDQIPPMPSPTEPHAVAKDSDREGKARQGDIKKSANGRGEEETKVSGEKTAVENRQFVKEPGAASSMDHESKQQKTDPSRSETSASVEAENKEQHRKAS
ncbi:MAG TPA: hypothetical protein VG498_14955 [Terriglobales bacterium]|nr:hypothetical protein [Terriglobales bacterium]